MLKLPEWVTCADCKHCHQCVAAFATEPSNKECTFTTSQFEPKSAKAMIAKARKFNAATQQPPSAAGDNHE